MNIIASHDITENMYCIPFYLMLIEVDVLIPSGEVNIENHTILYNDKTYEVCQYWAIDKHYNHKSHYICNAILSDFVSWAQKYNCEIYKRLLGYPTMYYIEILDEKVQLEFKLKW